MTRHFAKWAKKQNIPTKNLAIALEEVVNGNYEVALGGGIYKKRIPFRGKGKSGSGRTIICYNKKDRAIFLYGFAKNEKSNLTAKELFVYKELTKILFGLSSQQLKTAIENGDIIEVK